MQRDPRAYLPLTEAAFLILAALARPKHGYAIMQDVAEWSGGETKLGPGTLYGALTKLMGQKLIRRAGDAGGGDERRKEYVLTEMGRRVVEAECARLEAAARLGRLALKLKEVVR